MRNEEIRALQVAEQALVRLGGGAQVAHTVAPGICRITDHGRGVWAELTVRHPRAICRAGRITDREGRNDAASHIMLIPDGRNTNDVAAAIQELWRRLDEK